MYTGIIEATGTVRNVDRRDGVRVAIDAPFDREPGDSLAVNAEYDVLAKYARGEAVEA
ncbi:hypothetical protein [Natronomonas sp.]|uniref:hypothetical protein n=1 Tax=Natronomonas sp. TaxID=2184060 RepID=UPI002FC3AF2E